MADAPSLTSAPLLRKKTTRNPLRRLRIQRQQSADSDSTTRALIVPNRFRRKNRSSIIPSSITYDPRPVSVHEESTIDEDLLSLDATPIQKPKLPTATTRIAIIHTDSLPSAIALWLDCVQNLYHTQEFQTLLQCSRLVLHQSQQTAWNVVIMPVVVPRNLCLQATQTLLQSTSEVLANHQQQHENPLHPLAIPSLVLGITTKLVLTVVSPVLLLGHSASNEHDTRKVQKLDHKVKTLDDPVPDYLDRLRLDYGLPKDPSFCNKPDPLKPVDDKTVVEMRPKSTSSGTTSKYLLRVDDLDIQEPTGQVAYIDLDANAAPLNINLIQDALERLVAQGLGMAATNPDVQLSYESTVAMQWNAEGATRRLLRKIDDDVLLSETLIWSGRAESCKPHPFFLARGAIPISPRALLHLLWDNTRTNEYNNFCMGRSTLLSLGDNDADLAVLRNNANTATKIIKSEMRVPFAGFTVRAVCLMHVAPLPDGAGYAILSRTLDSGDSGNHMVPCESVQRSNNEILWGCNIIRPAASSSSHTELISMSQVGSNVPGFLSQKIGLMGISDFFRNVRSLR